jgi:hypothetical protein
VKGESSLLQLPGNTFGYGGTALSTTGENSRDRIAFKAGLESQANLYGGPSLYRYSLAFPWQPGVSQLFSTDKNGPFSGNTEAYTGAEGGYNNSIAPVEEVPAYNIASVPQAQLIDDQIPVQDPTACPSGGGGGSGLLVGSPILHGGS